MKPERYMDKNMLIKKFSIEILMDKVGLIETIRFLNILRKKELKA